MGVTAHGQGRLRSWDHDTHRQRGTAGRRRKTSRENVAKTAQNVARKIFGGPRGKIRKNEDFRHGAKNFKSVIDYN